MQHAAVSLHGTRPQHPLDSCEGYPVYIAFQDDKKTNFDLKTHDGEYLIYAASTPEQAKACLKNPTRVRITKAVIHPNVSGTIGYLPILQSRLDDYDVYVDNVDAPEIFLIKPSRVFMQSM